MCVARSFDMRTFMMGHSAVLIINSINLFRHILLTLLKRLVETSLIPFLKIIALNIYSCLVLWFPQAKADKKHSNIFMVNLKKDLGPI